MRVTGIAFDHNFSNQGVRTTDDMEGEIDLALALVTLFAVRDLRLMETVLFHDSLNARDSAVEFLGRVEFAQLQAAGASQLIRGGIGRNAFHDYHANEKIGDGEKAHADSGSIGACGFCLYVGEASGGKKRLDGVVEIFSCQGFANF